MKTRLICCLLAVALAVPAMLGCQRGTLRQGAVTYGTGAVRSVETGAASELPVIPALTPEKAQNIALKHAGVTAGQVTGLRVEFERDHGVSRYDVEFRQGTWEYDYEIHADTGEILSFSKED